MLKAVKTKLSNYLSPIFDRNRPEANCAGESSVDLNSRKRPLSQIDDNIDATPGKKKREEKFGIRSPLKLFDGFKWGSIFDKSSKENIVNMTQAESVVKNTTLLFPEKSDEDDVEITSSRKILTASRKKRVPLSQISNTTVLDLTCMNSDDERDEPEITNISIDLTKPFKGTSLPDDEKIGSSNVTIDLTTSSSSKTKLFGNISTSNLIGVLNRKTNSSLLHETVRLDERTRYKTLLAHYTNIHLPEYSESISPVKSGHNSSDEDDSVTTLSSTSWFSKKYEGKPVFVDLTEDITITEPISPVQIASRRKFFHELLSESRSSPSLLHSSSSTSFFTQDSSFLPSPSLTSTTSKPKADISALLDTDWIQKWRDTIDPIKLERERRIAEEEKRKEAIKRRQKEEFEELQKKAQESAKSEFVELTNEMKAEIKRALGPGNSRDVLVEGFNAEITRADIATLRNSTWLNDEVVNFYFNLLKERGEKDTTLPKVHIFNTFFYPKIMKVGHSGVKRWTRKIDIFSYDLILIPVHLGMHWCLAVVDFKNKEIVYYDSLRGNNPQCIIGLKKYLDDESRDKKKCEFDFDGWNEKMPKSIPEQMNGCDCGVFACKYAEYRSRDAKFTFTQENMPYFRQRMVYEICNKKLL